MPQSAQDDQDAPVSTSQKQGNLGQADQDVPVSTSQKLGTLGILGQVGHLRDEAAEVF